MLTCDFIAGCDGFHGVSRPAIPEGVLRVYAQTYPFAWLGILAKAEPTSRELVYALHERGFALHSMRSPSVSRNYLQVAADEDLRAWPDARIWEELGVRLGADGFSLTSGPVIEKSVVPMRAFVAEPMQYGRLFLAGDAAHIIPPTGAKGLNLAVADVTVLARALGSYYRTGDTGGLEAYSESCLKRVWQAQAFSAWLTTVLHRADPNDVYTYRLQLAQLEGIVHSDAAARAFAEGYVGAF